MRKIDVHVHYYPPQYLERLLLNEPFKVITDAAGKRALVKQGGLKTALTGNMDNIEERLAEMDRLAPCCQVILGQILHLLGDGI